MDFMLGTPPSKHNGIVYDAILVFIDGYSKIALYVLMKKTITALQDQIYCMKRLSSRLDALKVLYQIGIVVSK
jgi:hypothetical protein